MAESRTDLLIQAKAKGFKEVQQEATKIIDAAQKATLNQTKGFAKLEGGSKSYSKEIKNLEKSLKDLAKQQLATTRAMADMEKGSKVYKQLGENLKNINAQYSRMSGMKAKLQELFGPRSGGGAGQPLSAQDMARGGFMQGLAQGGLQVDLQRGPGMWRQAAGRSVGAMGRGFAGAPFGGVQGLQQGLAGIPGIGGLLAGQLGTAMGFGEQALGLQQTRLQAMPMFGGGSAQHARIAAARARGEGATGLTEENIRGSAAASGLAAMAGPLEFSSEKTGLGASLAKGAGATAVLGPMGPLLLKGIEAAGGAIQKALLSPEQETQMREGMRQRAEAETEARLRGERKGAGAKAAREEAQEPFAAVRKAGAEFGGLSEAEAIQAITPLLQRAGGKIGAAQEQGMIPAAFAAQTVYGVGAETAGGFLGAGRRGGMVGAKGRAGEMMAETIGDAISLGLEGSELTDYMSQMANGFENWKQTGMPINPKSIQALSTSFAQGGLGGLRGAITGQQFAKAGQRLAQTGVQDQIDLLMMETVGGYKGGGMKEYMDALEKLEGMDIGSAEGMMEMIRKLSGGGEGDIDTSAWIVKQALGRKGMSLGTKEARLFVKKATGQTLSKDDEKILAEKQAEMSGTGAEAPKGAAGLAEQATAMMGDYGAAMRRAANLQNKQNTIGEAMLPTLQNLQDSSSNVAGAFQRLADGPLKDVSGVIVRFTAALEKIATKIDQGEPLVDTFVSAIRGAM